MSGLDPQFDAEVVADAAWHAILDRSTWEAVAKLSEGFDGGLFALLPLDADDLPQLPYRPKIGPLRAIAPNVYGAWSRPRAWPVAGASRITRS